MVRPGAALLTFDDALRELGAAPRWGSAQTEALEGEVDGVMMRRWARNLRGRHGPRALERVRARLGPWSTRIPPDPRPTSRLPVAAQVVLTESIADELHGGDLHALAPLVREDVRRDIPLPARLGLRAYGAERALGHVSEVHARLYTVGRASAEVEPGRALVRYEGAPLFGQPTWRFIAVTSLSIVIEAGAGHPPTEAGFVAPGEEEFEVELRW